VKTRLVQKEIKVFREDLKKKNFMTGRAGWYGDYGDPTTFLDINITGNGNNDRGFSHAPYDDLLRRAENLTDPVARKALLTQAERLLVEEQLPLIPIFHYATLYMFNARELTGVSSHPRTLQMFARYDVLGDGIGPDVPAWSRHAPISVGAAPMTGAQP
jgi:oligopeptide transport system substrate-binding protein